MILAASRLIAVSASVEERDLLLTAVDLDVDDVEALNVLISKSLVPGLQEAHKFAEAAIRATSVKLKAWALAHMKQARQLGRDTKLFEKLINDPEMAVRQLAKAWVKDSKSNQLLNCL